jgi:hypothetical protein
MLEAIVAYAVMAAPYVLIAVGILGVWLAIARITVKTCVPVARGG